MARKPAGTLEAAMALLIHNQAAWVRSMRKRDEEFEEIKRILLRHEQILANLPEVIRQKVGFRQKPS